MDSIDLRCFSDVQFRESRCTTAFKVERVMSFPTRERKERAMRNAFGLESQTVSLQYASL